MRSSTGNWKYVLWNVVSAPQLSSLWPRLSFFNVHVRNCLISTSGLKSNVIIVFLDPNFLYDAGIPAICGRYRQKLTCLSLHGFSRPFGPKWRFGGKIGEGTVQCLPPNELVLALLAATFGENRSRKATVDRQTDRQTHAVSDKNCPML